MTFLNPLVLFGLVAAAIPLILHLLNLRKLRTIEFSTLTFLKELQQTKIRKLKLRQILLLIVRTLLIIFIILAFARPALRGKIFGTIGAQAHSSVVFILDDSFSMTTSDEHGEYYKQAKDAAARLIDLLKDGDEAYLVKLSDVPKATIDPATHDFSALRKAINETSVSSIHRQLDDALRLSASLLQRSRNANKEVYVISDLQATLINARLQGNPPENIFDQQVKLFAVEIGSKTAPNVGLDSITMKTRIFEPQKPIVINASLRNFGNAPLHNYVVSLFLDGIRAAQQSVSVEQWGSVSLELHAIPKHTGFLKGYVELEHDATEEDDRRYFSIYIPERINVGIVSNGVLENQFIRLALQSSTENTASSLMSVQQASIQKFSLLDLKKIDVLIVADATTLSTNDAQRIKDFVEHGGGLILFPQSSLTNSSNTTSALLTQLAIPQIEHVSIEPTGNSISFQKVDLDHPLFTSIFEQASPGRQTRQEIESPSITTALVRQTGNRGRTIISLPNGSPFLSEHSAGEGKILFFSVSPVLSWSDFPLKGIFAPLIHRSVIYTSSRSEIIPALWVGDEPTVTANRSGTTTTNVRHMLLLPDGTQELLQPAEHSGSNVGRARLSFSLKQLQQSGLYEIRNDTTTLTVFAANIDPRESDFRKMSRDEFEKTNNRFGIHNIQFLEPNDRIQSAIMQSRFGVELWRYCLSLALLLALLEMLIARDSRKALQNVTG